MALEPSWGAAAGHALNVTGPELGRCAKGTFRQARLEEAQETMGRFDCQGGTLNMLPRLAAFQMSVPFITAEGSRARPMGISQQERLSRPPRRKHDDQKAVTNEV